MNVSPTPTPDEIAAIVVAITSATSHPDGIAAEAEPSRWRIAGRDYTRDWTR